MAVPSPSSPLPGKSGLRAEGLRLRRGYARSLLPELRAALEAALARLVLPHLAGAGIVAAYHPLKDEISPAAILAALGPGQRAAFPWFADREARFVWREGPATEPGPWGVLQPPAEAEALAPDVVLVPIVLADRHGTRIGHGKGHYDRALAHLREGGTSVTAIGLCWEDQLGDSPLPADPWDMKLDAIATPKEWVTCG
ncbi:MAG: 5-formyltetrahydrofolate cyclo-ligase [Sphingomonadales bacterium]|jgi:5-formyltetrahydrofolate cyclo-ligase|nr:5-formyltetrahydrofolate cyclo-ligase [Sphingomonadales bacterium]